MVMLNEIAYPDAAGLIRYSRTVKNDDNFSEKIDKVRGWLFKNGFRILNNDGTFGTIWWKQPDNIVVKEFIYDPAYVEYAVLCKKYYKKIHIFLK